MKAFNKPRKEKHTTKIKWKLCVFDYFTFSKYSKKKSYTDDLFGDDPIVHKRYF